MTIDALHTFGTQEVVEVPGSGASPGTANDQVSKAPSGILYRHQGNIFRYVQFDKGTGSVAAVAGGPVYWKTLTPTSSIFLVTSDYTDSVAGINGIAGILGTIVTDQFWTWIQVAGICSAMVKAHALIGAQLLGYASADLTFDFVAVNANPTGNVFGIVHAANLVSTNSNTTVLLQNLAW